MSQGRAGTTSGTPGFLARNRASFRQASDERGAYLILFAILLTVLFLMAALVIDLGLARAQRRNNRLVADLSSRAAGPLLPGDPRGACAAAWSIVRANIRTLPAGASMPCTSVPSPCVDGTAATTYTATGTSEWTISIVHPVPDADLEGPGPRPHDGTDPCERMRVIVLSEHPTLFGGLAGKSSLDVYGSAVVRGFVSNQQDAVVALLLLDPVGCEALLAQGNGGVRVYPSGAIGGYIALDSDGSNSLECGGESFTMDAEGNPSRIYACGVGSTDPGCLPGGTIALYAMESGQSRCDTGSLVACHQADVSASPARVFPQPGPLEERLTRAPVDHRYNCKTGYPVYRGVVAIPDCSGASSGSDYIDELRAALGGPGTGAPPGFTDALSDPASGLTGCDTTASGDPIVVPEGNWWINCPAPDGFVIKKSVTFRGGNILFEGKLNLTSQGSLSVNESNSTPALTPSCESALCPAASSATHAFIYIRDQEFIRSGGAPLRMRGTALYIDDDNNNGFIDLTGGEGAFFWTAPTEGPFEDLLLWSESTLTHILAGQAGQVLEGVFFTPEALFEYAGQGSQDQADAQFIAYRLTARGQGVLRMQPDPDRAVHFPVSGWRMIR